MNVIYDNQERDRIAQARESYSGRLLTDSQFDEAIAITGIMEGEINKTGTFKQKLGDYAYAFARTEKFDMLRAADTIRDLFKARTGQTMNQMRETLMKREEKLIGHKEQRSLSIHNPIPPASIEPKLSATEKARSLKAAENIGQMIIEGNKMPFYRAYAHQATELAKDFGITESGAKTLMKQQFQENQNTDLYGWGKELEEKYYKPQIEAEKQARENARTHSPDVEMQRSYTRSR